MGEVVGQSVQQSDVERLYWAASHHARAANEKVTSPDRNLRMEAAIHSGAAVELMAKAILANVDPRLVLDDRDGHHILIDILVETGMTIAQPFARKGKKSVIAAKAVELAARVCGEVRPHVGEAKRALDARNSAAHLAEIDDGRLADQVTAGSDFVLAGVDSFERSRAAFLGHELAEQVEQNVAQRNAGLRAKARRKVHAARLRYDGLVARLPDGAGADVLTELGKRIPTHGDHTEPYDCPACSNRGWLIWDVDVDVEYEGPGEYSTNAFLVFLGFDCPYCSLQLNDLESEVIGIDPHGDPAEDFADK